MPCSFSKRQRNFCLRKRCEGHKINITEKESVQFRPLNFCHVFFGFLPLHFRDLTQYKNRFYLRFRKCPAKHFRTLSHANFAISGHRHGKVYRCSPVRFLSDHKGDLGPRETSIIILHLLARLCPADDRASEIGGGGGRKLQNWGQQTVPLNARFCA